MSVSAQNQDPGDPNPELFSLTLEPFRRNGPDALDCHDFPQLHSLNFVGALIKWDNHHCDTEVVTPAALSEDPQNAIPEGANIVEATLCAVLAGRSELNSITIKPPSVVQTDSPGLRQTFLAWATKHNFSHRHPRHRPCPLPFNRRP